MLDGDRLTGKALDGRGVEKLVRGPKDRDPAGSVWLVLRQFLRGIPATSEGRDGAVLHEQITLVGYRAVRADADAVSVLHLLCPKSLRREGVALHSIGSYKFVREPGSRRRPCLKGRQSGRSARRVSCGYHARPHRPSCTTHSA